MKRVNDFLDDLLSESRDLGGSACRHVLQTELLNCGLEQPSGMPWPWSSALHREGLGWAGLG